MFAPKFRSPRLRPGLVGRPRLTKQLVKARGTLVVVAAPPGFGKSTLLAQWEAADPRRFAFVSLEPSDNDPLELWNGVVTAVRQVVPSFGASVEPMLQSVGGTAVGPLVDRVAAELDQLDEPVVVVLDDYHVIHNPACHASVEALTAHPASETPLAVSTRSDPPVPLGRLRASGELVELRGSDLAFTRAETEEALNGTMGLGLSAGELEILDGCTEGWPAGLQLAALGLQASADRQQFLSSFGGSNRHIVDYLSEVVLDSLDEDARRFLLQTSILSELSGPLCDAVTGRDDSARLLDSLQRSNVFVIPLDDQRQWYRYHHLFGELLREQLTLTIPGQAAGLHRAAAAWFAGAGRSDEAIRHAIAADNLPAAGDLVVSGWVSRVASGRLTTVLGWLGQFPRGHVSGNASLSVISAWVNGLLGHDAAARQAVEDLLAADSPGPLPDGSHTVEHAAALFLSLFLLKSDVDELRAASRLVREFRGELRPEFQPVAAFSLGVGAFFGADPEEARAELERAIELATAFGIWIVVIDALGFSIQVALMQHRTEDAETLASSLVELSGTHGLQDLPHVGYYLASAGAAMARSGRLEEGDELLGRGIGQLAHWSPLLAGHARLMRAPVRRQLGDAEGARNLIDQARDLLAECASTGIIGDLLPQVARALSASPRRGEDWSELTDRELSVLGLLEQGLSQREIASQLFLSFHTVHSHAKSIYIRLGVTSREEAIERARELDLLLSPGHVLYRRRPVCGWPADQFDEAEHHQQQDDDQHDDRDGRLPPEHEDQRSQRHRAYAQSAPVRIGPPADRASPQASGFAAVADPAQAGGEPGTHPYRSRRRARQEGARGDHQAGHQQRAQRRPDEPDQDVEGGGRGVGRQCAGRHAAQVKATGDEQARAEHQHGCGQPERRADQRPPVPAGDQHTEAQQQQGQDRQHDLQGVDQPVGALRLLQVLGREQRERGVHDRDLARHGQPAGDQILLRDRDQRGQVQGDLAVADDQRTAGPAGQGCHQLLVRGPVDLHPGRRHPRARDDLGDLAVHEALDGTGQRARKALDQRGGLGQALLVEGGRRLAGQRGHVDPGDDLVGDLVGQCALDGGIMDQRRHIGHIRAGVGDLVGRPDR
jgi:LuxR family maltose regulon positive regulatory protein